MIILLVNVNVQMMYLVRVWIAARACNTDPQQMTVMTTLISN